MTVARWFVGGMFLLLAACGSSDHASLATDSVTTPSPSASPEPAPVHGDITEDMVMALVAALLAHG